MVDLQSYMDALNKKNVAVSKMIGTIGSCSDITAQTWNPHFFPYLEKVISYIVSGMLLVDLIETPAPYF